jgi:hypothetical protein
LIFEYYYRSQALYLAAMAKELLPDSVLTNWQKNQPIGRNYINNFCKEQKNDVLKQLPDLHEEAFSKIDCLQCAACCKNYSPRFKTPDIKRISKLLKMKEGEFVETYLREDEDGDFVLQQLPCPF